MAWSRSGKSREFIWVGSQTSNPGLMIQGLWYGPNAFFDWSTRKFVQTQPLQLLQPLMLQTVPQLPGLTQRFTYDLKTSDFPDGEYIAYYADVPSGMLYLYPQAERFFVYLGSAVGIIPNPQIGTT